MPSLDPRQQDLYAAWRREQQARQAVPPRQAFDPIRHPRSLSTVILAEVVDDSSLCFRLVGTDMVDAWGADFTGKHLHEVMRGDYHDFIRGLFDECIARRGPIFSHSRFQWDKDRSVDTRRIMLPYARNEAPEKIGFVLVSQVFDYGKVGPGQPQVSADPNFEITELTREVLGT